MLQQTVLAIVHILYSFYCGKLDYFWDSAAYSIYVYVSVREIYKVSDYSHFTALSIHPLKWTQNIGILVNMGECKRDI